MDGTSVECMSSFIRQLSKDMGESERARISNYVIRYMTIENLSFNIFLWEPSGNRKKVVGFDNFVEWSKM